MNYIPQYINNLKVKKKRKFKKHHVLIYLFNHDELYNTAAKADGVVKDLSADYTEGRTRRKTLKARERPTITLPHMSSKKQHRYYTMQGGHHRNNKT